MRVIDRCVALMYIIAVPNVAATQSFQGVIDMQLTAPDFSASYTQQIKGNKVRTQTTAIQSKKPMPAADQAALLATYQIWDGDKKATFNVMPAQKTYTVSSAADMAAMAGELSKGQKAAASRVPAMSKTGKKEAIAGFTCEHWLIGDRKPADVCLAKGLGFMGVTGQSGMGGLGAAFPAMDRASIQAAVAANPELKELAEGGAFPLKVEMDNGKMSMVVTRIEKASLGDDLFKPPAGYKEMNVGSMMKDMMQKLGKKP